MNTVDYNYCVVKVCNHDGFPNNGHAIVPQSYVSQNEDNSRCFIQI